MTGPEHYRRAEQLAEQAHVVDPEYAAYLVAKAQVHATLALTAATAMMPTVGNEGQTAAEWRKVIVPPRTEDARRLCEADL